MYSCICNRTSDDKINTRIISQITVKELRGVSMVGGQVVKSRFTDLHYPEMHKSSS